MIIKKDYKFTSVVFMAFFIFLMAGWLTLISTFQFPDILRESVMERFTLFQENKDIIVPAYYIMSLTSILQVFMAVSMYHLTKKGKFIDIVSLTAGVLSGVFQILGFFRWVILIPMLSDALNANEISSDIIFFFEKFANTYLGMTVGEHLRSFFTGLWVISLGIILINNSSFDKKLSILGLVSGVAVLAQSFETVSSSFSFLGEITAPLWGLYLVWVLIMSITLFAKKDDSSLTKVHWATWIIGLIIYLANVIPSFM
ncbi:putative membrane protein [Clostridium algifaecis]|uniref:Membrane protein n=1 Tax=Clostridium algifaecis TaxID=1472040 RepID=A0ABS4KTG8_9CLOT|nr:DUF4386 family protein [Clostridium algifaecis]MBP2033322.1 putative membrane protein [Clostridium algifaecis]